MDTADDYVFYTTDHNGWRPWRLAARNYYTAGEVAALALAGKCGMFLRVPPGDNCFRQEIKRLLEVR